MTSFFNLKGIFNSSKKEDIDIIYDVFYQIKNNKNNEYDKNIIKNIKKLTRNDQNLINEQDESGNSLLHYASYYGYNSIVSLLLASGSDWDLKNNLGQTPIFKSVINNKYTTFNLLNKYPVVYNNTDNSGNTLLHYALKRGNIKIIQDLVNKNANQHIKNNESKFPLHYIIDYKKENIKSINVFFSNSGLDENILLDDDNNNIAHLTIIKKNYELLNELLIHKNFKHLFLQVNKNSLTPLFLAAELKDQKAFDMLLSQTENSFINNKLNTYYDLKTIISEMKEYSLISLFKDKNFTKNLNNYKKGFGEELLILVNKKYIKTIEYILNNFKLSSCIPDLIYEEILFKLLDYGHKELFEKISSHYKVNNSIFLSGFKYFLDSNILKNGNIDNNINYLLRKQKIYIQQEKDNNKEKNIDDSLSFLNFLLDIDNKNLFNDIVLTYIDIGISFKNITKKQYVQNGSILHKSIQKSNLLAVQKISLMGIDIDILDAENQSPIELSVKINNFDIFEFLSYRTKKINSSSESFSLLEMTMKNNSFSAFSHLVSLIDVKNCSLNGIDILDFCILENKIDYVKKLVFSGIFLRNKTYSGYSNLLTQKIQNSFYLAGEKDYLDIFKFLFEEGAEINLIPEKNTYTPLQICIINNSYNCFTFLLNNKADLNKLSDITSESSLHIAVKHGHYKMVKDLLEHGADINNKANIKKQTPLDYSLIYKHNEIYELLLEKGAVDKK